MKTATRKIVSKEIQQDADVYVGSYGEVWFQEGSQSLRFGDTITPGGVPLRGGGVSGAATLCEPAQATVVFTASSSTVTTLKVTAQARGFDTGFTDFEDVHSADMVVVKNVRTGLAEASVYGVTHTSSTALVTFDAQISNNLLQVVATPTSLTNSVTVKTTAIEIEA